MVVLKVPGVFGVPGHELTVILIGDLGAVILDQFVSLGVTNPKILVLNFDHSPELLFDVDLESGPELCLLNVLIFFLFRIFLF